MPEVRLIDGNRLAEIFEEAADKGAGVLATVYRDAAHFARTAPTIEPEVRRGRWITRDSKTAKCSCCGWWQHARMYYLPDDIQEFSKCYLFCTACGAQMDGGADNA